MKGKITLLKNDDLRTPYSDLLLGSHPSPISNDGLTVSGQAVIAK